MLSETQQMYENCVNTKCKIDGYVYGLCPGKLINLSPNNKCLDRSKLKVFGDNNKICN